MTDLGSDFAKRVQLKAEMHLMACMEAEDEPGDHESPAYAPFDGCMTCIVREVLMVAWDELIEEVRREHAAERADAEVPQYREGHVVRLVPRPGDD